MTFPVAGNRSVKKPPCSLGSLISGHLTAGLGCWSLLAVLSVGQSWAFDTEPQMTFEQRQKAVAFQHDHLQHLQLGQPKPTPEFVQKYNRLATAAAERDIAVDQQKTGRWFFAYNRVGGDNGPEYATVHRYSQLLLSYGNLKNLPGYSKENYDQAVRYWQSWQDPTTGRFRNVDDPTAPINGKYMPALLTMLQVAPLYPWMADGGAGLNPESVTRICARRPWYSTQFHTATFQQTCMLTAIHEGHSQYVPHLEQGLELLLPMINPKTGMLGGPNNLTGANWSDYSATADTLKGGARLVGYMGVENLPYRHQRADHLLRNLDHFCGSVSVQRNMLEACVHCLTESTYRRDELYGAIEKIAQSAMHGSPWETQHTASYVTYLFCLAGGVLHWDLYDGRLPLTPQVLNNGVLHDWRILIGPYGRVATVYKKPADAIFWNPNWNNQRYLEQSYAVRNDQHDRRTIHEVVPMRREGWAFHQGPNGHFVGETTFSLSPENGPLEFPFLKMTWDRPITIWVNGKKTSHKMGTMSEPGGIFLPEDIAATLQPGSNTIRIETATKSTAAPQVAIGLIDWRLADR